MTEIREVSLAAIIVHRGFDAPTGLCGELGIISGRSDSGTARAYWSLPMRGRLRRVSLPPRIRRWIPVARCEGQLKGASVQRKGDWGRRTQIVRQAALGLAMFRCPPYSEHHYPVRAHLPSQNHTCCSRIHRRADGDCMKCPNRRKSVA
jgi:hypothetical protein